MSTTYTVPNLNDYSAESLDSKVRELLHALDTEAGSVSSEHEWRSLRDRWMARTNGILRQVNDTWLKSAPNEQKRVVGQRVNELKKKVEDRIDVANPVVTHLTEELLSNPKDKRSLERALVFGVTSQRIVELQELRDQANADGDSDGALKYTEALKAEVRAEAQRQGAAAKLESERVDVTLPGIRRELGAEHPVVRTQNEIVAVFKAMGYSVSEGPEIESDYYNFESLNFPPNHPARDTQDTIFIAGQELRPQRDRLLLRTHTSPVQIRSMEKYKPPVRIVIPGKVHRNDAPDATHSPVFHQVEGLAVDTNITFCDLKGTIDHAMKSFFGSSVKTRFQPSFFPFTEPSAEVSISCIFCGGKLCRVCKYSGWIELLGCGMVDPNVFEFIKDNGYDPAKVSGFAFGMGVERIAMLKWGIDDIQQFYYGDVRFLRQFA
jgi:phenylalanyl-tRNA synthetase alpha chain